jgi:hypothetical protein
MGDAWVPDVVELWVDRDCDWLGEVRRSSVCEEDNDDVDEDDEAEEGMWGCASGDWIPRLSLEDDDDDDVGNGKVLLSAGVAGVDMRLAVICLSSWEGERGSKTKQNSKRPKEGEKDTFNVVVKISSFYSHLLISPVHLDHPFGRRTLPFYAFVTSC